MDVLGDDVDVLKAMVRKYSARIKELEEALRALVDLTYWEWGRGENVEGSIGNHVWVRARDLAYPASDDRNLPQGGE